MILSIENSHDYASVEPYNMPYKFIYKKLSEILAVLLKLSQNYLQFHRLGISILLVTV